MSSSAQFSHGLNNWNDSDKPTRLDFVDDNELLEEGTMWKAEFDADGAVEAAGGITAYVLDEMNDLQERLDSSFEEQFDSVLLRLSEANLERIYPVGSIYMSTVDTNPAVLFGVGTWERAAIGRMLVGVDPDNAELAEPGVEGGEKEHVLTVDEMPRHAHPYPGQGYWIYSNITNNFSFGSGQRASAVTSLMPQGGDQPHNNMPPYETAYIWKRVA